MLPDDVTDFRSGFSAGIILLYGLEDRVKRHTSTIQYDMLQNIFDEDKHL